MDGKCTDSVASPSDSLEGAHVHAINTRPFFFPRGAGSEVRYNHDTVMESNMAVISQLANDRHQITIQITQLINSYLCLF